MKVILFGKNKEHIRPMVEHAGFTIVEENPEFVISFGGDGTLMHAENAFPGIPKILLKDSMICKKCSPLPNEEVLKRIASKEYRTEELMKLEASSDGATLRSMNDIIIHNKDARHAIRYALSINDTVIGSPIIGDGVVIATPFGSTAYYRSITDSFFELGIGLAFNNSTEQSDHMVLKEDSVIRIPIIRGPAVVYADNQEDSLTIEMGSEIEIKKSASTTSLIIPA